MLREKIFYKDELPVSVITANVVDYPFHFHDDMEIVYVLSGSIILKSGYYTYTLKQGDMFILNDRDMHSLERTEEENMVMMLQMNLSYFERYYSDLRNQFFVVDMEEDREEDLTVLRNILAEIMMEILQKGQGYEHKVIESTHNLISCLISDFCYVVTEDGKFQNETGNRTSKILAGRLNRIMDYMYENYERKLTLSEIAENEKLSIYYLSHIIKEATGLSFQDLLSYIRVEESERLLLESSKKIGAIAEEMGFSAVRYYIKHFENWFGMHPLEYRKKYMGKSMKRESRAKYKRCSPMEIEGAIRALTRSASVDAEDKLMLKPVILDIGTMDSMESGGSGTPEGSDSAKVTVGDAPAGDDLLNAGIFTIMERGVNDILAEPYHELMNLEETVLAAGENYLVTAEASDPEDIQRLSILVYNYDENVGRSLRKIHTENDLLRLVRHYDDEIEFLIRCNGFSGSYRIYRYRMDRDNLAKKLTDSINPEGTSGKRDVLIGRLTGAPTVTTNTYTSSDVLSVRTTFQGMGMELILVDRI